MHVRQKKDGKRTSERRETSSLYWSISSRRRRCSTLRVSLSDSNSSRRASESLSWLFSCAFFSMASSDVRRCSCSSSCDLCTTSKQERLTVPQVSWTEQAREHDSPPADLSFAPGGPIFRPEGQLSGELQLPGAHKWTRNSGNKRGVSQWTCWLKK